MRPPSLRSALIIASVLWTAGLLALLHMGMIALIRTVPGVRGSHGHGLLVAAILCIAAAIVTVRRALHPLEQIGARVRGLRKGSQSRIDGSYPREVQPLIDDLNRLLEEREQSMKRAWDTAGDLAHALKTPLALLTQEAERHNSATMTELIDRISRQVSYQLARARATASGASRTVPCPVAPVADAIVRTVAKLYAERGLVITSDIAGDVSVGLQLEDLEELLGNVVDNACKWAGKRVQIAADCANELVTITVDDDGPGLPPEVRQAVLRRGVRLDEASAGSGLGLAIVKDITELYGGTLSLGASPSDGLRVSVAFNSAPR